MFVLFVYIIYNVKYMIKHNKVYLPHSTQSSMTVPLRHPFSAIISGPSQAGKSQWVAKLLHSSSSMISPAPKQIHLCFSEWQPLYDSFKDVQFHKGLIDVDSLDIHSPKLLILDDLMELLATKEGELISQIFTKHGHHRNISIILITQNVFQKGPHMRNCQLNSHYQVLFKNPRDKTQIHCLVRQMYPKGQSKFLVDAFVDATSVPYGSLLVDLKSDTDDLIRVRTNIFPDENTYVYLTKEQASHLVSESRRGKT